MLASLRGRTPVPAVFCGREEGLEYRARRLEGDGDSRILCQNLVKLFLCQVDILKLDFSAHEERHRKDKNAQLFRLTLCNTAVAVGSNSCSCHSSYSCCLFLEKQLFLSVISCNA